GRVAGAGMDHQPGRLVQHEQVLVLVQHVKRDVLGHRLGLDLGHLGQADGLAALHRVARARRLAVQQGVAGLDPGGQAGTGIFGEQLGQYGIETAAGGLVGDGGLAGGVWGLGHRGAFGMGSGQAKSVAGQATRLSSALPISAGMPSPMALSPRSSFPSALRLVALLVLVALFATGCGRDKKKKDADEGRPVAELYEKGHGYMERGNWAGAETVFRRLVAQYPYGPYTEQALMETAYAQYKAGRHDEAVSTIDRFIRTYPTHRTTTSPPSPTGAACPTPPATRCSCSACGRWVPAAATCPRRGRRTRTSTPSPSATRTAATPPRRASAWSCCATCSPATRWTSRCTTCAAAPGCRPSAAPGTSSRPTRRATTSTTPSPPWPSPTTTWARSSCPRTRSACCA